MARRFGVFLVALLFPAAPALAGLITFELTSLGGSQFQYTYTVVNDGSPGSAPILGLDVYFDPTLYSLDPEINSPAESQLAAPEGWSPLVLFDMPGSIPAAYDALTSGAGVVPGESLSGFVVQFTWLGEGLPGPQPFEFYDPTDYSVTQSGTTTPAVSVPEPAGTAGLLALGLLSLALLRRLGL
jgi:hypothetical protein